MQDHLQQLRTKALAELSQANNTSQLQQWRVAVLGKKGQLTEVLKEVGRLPAAERPVFGQAANSLKLELESALEAREGELKAQELRRALEAERIDVTLPGRPPAAGLLHPTTQIVNQVAVRVRLHGLSGGRRPRGGVGLLQL